MPILAFLTRLRLSHAMHALTSIKKVHKTNLNSCLSNFLDKTRDIFLNDSYSEVETSTKLITHRYTSI